MLDEDIRKDRHVRPDLPAVEDRFARRALDEALVGHGRSDPDVDPHKLRIGDVGDRKRRSRIIAQNMTPSGRSVAWRTASTARVIAATVCGGTLSLANGASKKFSTMTADAPPASSARASATARSIAGSMPLPESPGLPGRGARCTIPIRGRCCQNAASRPP